MATASTVPDKLDRMGNEMRVVEAAAGPARRRWIENRLEAAKASGIRTFYLRCQFTSGGPWAGVSELFFALFDDIQSQRPDLVERHSLELVYLMPHLRRSLTVKNPTLTDMSSHAERVRSYPADRAFRAVHGLIDLLDAWKKTACPDEPWLIACDGYDEAGAMGSCFFREVMRRRGKSLHLSMLLAVESGKGEEVGRSLKTSLSRLKMMALDLPAEPNPITDASTAERMATALEESIGEDPIETQIHLQELIRLWEEAGRPDKVLKYKWFGLDLYNTLGLYTDALRYADGLLECAFEHKPDNRHFHWSIMVKVLNALIGLQDTPATLKLAEGTARELAEPVPAWRSYLYYMLAMLYARYQKPRDLNKGEDYLERGLAALQEAKIPESELHFQTVFNRNGLAMVRNFQGRHQEAIELCRAGFDQLNKYLAADQHRLHRSVLVYNIGQVYFATGNHDEALKHYASAIAMDPNYSEYYNERGSIFLQLGRLNEALADYLKAIELSPPYFEVFTNLGQCYRRMGAMEDAIASYSRAIDIEPDHVLALLGRAKAHEELGHVEAAIADYNQALAHDDTLWEALASRGVMYYEAGNLQASLADFDSAIKAKPGESSLYENRATVLADLGRSKDAMRDLETVLTFNLPEEDKRAIQERLQLLQGAEKKEGASVC